MRISSTIVLAVSCAVLPVSLPAQSRITTPLQEFGHNIGDDYFLANYAQLAKYWAKLDRESNRMRVVRIGTTAEGRPMLMALITSPENHAKLARYQDIAARLARAEGLTDAQARTLAREGKAVVWIDGGLHASEVLGAQQLIQFVFEMVSRNDAETQRFLRDVILLAVPANPDGMDLVSNWYMREAIPSKRSTSHVPVLYHKYIGHDNNRDSYMASQPETQAMDSIMFRAWYPQIMYNHHQTGPAGTVIFAPPFRDPFNYNLDPLVPVGVDLVGAAIHNRFIAEGKPGSTMRSGASYSTWWNGGLRTTAYFHNMIGLLTETIGNPTPMTVAFRPDRLLPSGSLPYPILPQTWHFAQSLAYVLSANRAVMDIASKYREDLLFNIYRMGRNSIERGSRDNWTSTPKRVNVVRAAFVRDSSAKAIKTPAQYVAMLRLPEERDPRGYIIPSDQADFPTAVRFVNALVKNGITIHRATRPFKVGGRDYPAGSYVVKTAQAFRPHIVDMFEPQDHPDDIPYPGGPPTPPYDNAGWTLAYQMGIRFDRILDPFDGPFERLVGFGSMPAPAVAAGASWYAIDRRSNDAFTAVNRLLARGEEVYSLSAPARAGGRLLSAGTFLVRARAGAPALARQIASEKGVEFEPVQALAGESGLSRLRLPRIAVYDRYGGSIESGWLRFILEQFEFPYEVVFPPTIDAGTLNAKYDVLILTDSASVPGVPGHASSDSIRPESIPPEWRSRLGSMTIAKSLPQIRSFVANGGTLLAIGEGSDVAYRLDLPVASAVADGEGKALPRSRYYVPGSILSVAVDTSSAIGWGMRPRADVFFDNNPAFRLLPDARARGIKRVAWFDSETPLRSGWAWGQKALDGASAVVIAPIGKGQVILYGPEIYFRSQSHGTFPFLFNGIYYSQNTPR